MTSHNQLLIRQATHADIPAIVNLFSICLRHEGGSPTENFWHWKHLQNPFGQSPVLLAFSDDQLVGLRAFLQWQWKCDAKVLNAFRAVDTATHPNFQGKGIFRKLTTQLWDKLQQDYPESFVYNTPNDKSRPGYLKMGWQILGKPAADFRFAPGLGLNRNRNWQKAINTLASIQFGAMNHAGSSQHGAMIRTNVSADYYSWRYQKVPDRQYGYWQCELSSGVVGFIFYLRQRLGFVELRICDEIVLQCNGDDRSLRNEGWALLAKEYSGCVVTKLCQYKEGGSQLLKPFIPRVTLRLPDQLSGLPKGIADIGTWHFEMGALELF